MENAIECKDVRFRYDAGSKWVINGASFSLPFGSRTVLVGLNGAGKSTLLRLIAGQHLADGATASDAPPVRCCGKDAFRDATLNRERTLMDTQWGVRTVAFGGVGVAYSADLRVGEMMRSLQEEFPARADELATVLGVDRRWWWNRLSEGQRRRVQLFLGLLVPVRVVMLDEVTSLLDVVSRADLFAFLRKESEQRGVAVVVATHVFDGVDGWATRMLQIRAAPHAQAGTIAYDGPVPAAGSVPLHTTVEQRLRAEHELKRREEAVAEEEAGEQALLCCDPRAVSTACAGGYAPGRSGRIMDHNTLALSLSPRSMELFDSRR